MIPYNNQCILEVQNVVKLSVGKGELKCCYHFKFSTNNSVTKIFVITVKGLEPATQAGCYHSNSKTHVRDISRIFKSSPLNASVLISFTEFTEFSETSVPFRKNSNDFKSMGHRYFEHVFKLSSVVTVE